MPTHCSRQDKRIEWLTVSKATARSKSTTRRVFLDIELKNVLQTVRMDRYSRARYLLSFWFFTAFQETPRWQVEAFRDGSCFSWFLLSCSEKHPLWVIFSSSVYVCISIHSHLTTSCNQDNVFKRSLKPKHSDTCRLCWMCASDFKLIYANFE